MALGLRLEGSASRVYCVVGDGEMDEGQIWEAAMAGAAYGADNLVAIVDRNRVQATDITEKVMPEGNVSGKWAAFGWNVIEIDGHDFDQILGALDAARSCKGKPTAIIVKSVKGKGVSFMEDQASWHGAAPNDEQYAIAVADIKATM